MTESGKLELINKIVKLPTCQRLYDPVSCI